MTLALIMSGIIDSNDSFRFAVLWTFPFLLFSTLSFTLIITVMSNIMIAFAILATNDDMNIFYEIMIAMIIQAVMLL